MPRKPAAKKTTTKAAKPTKDQINKLFNRLAETAASEAQHPVQRRSPEELLYDKNDLTPYKKHQAWPGKSYFLVGNSYNTEPKVRDTAHATRRTACIAMIIERGRDNVKCSSVQEALAFEGFAETLSRFEYDWLRKQPPSTLIGPAYDQKGNLVPEAFAVWRYEESFKSAPKKKALAVR